MDISKYSTAKAADVTHTVQFIDPTDGQPLEHDGQPMFAVIVGKNSKAWERALSRSVNAVKAAEKFGEKPFSLASSKSKTASLLAACTKRLVYFAAGEWVDIENDITLDSSPEHRQIRDSYLEFEWMIDKIDQDMGNEANFLGKSEKSSVPLSDSEPG